MVGQRAYNTDSCINSWRLSSRSRLPTQLLPRNVRINTLLKLQEVPFIHRYCAAFVK